MAGGCTRRAECMMLLHGVSIQNNLEPIGREMASVSAPALRAVVLAQPAPQSFFGAVNACVESGHGRCA